MNHAVETEQAIARPENVVGRRIVAALIDVAALAVVYFVFAAFSGGVEVEEGNVFVNLDGLPFLLFLLVVFAYYALFEAILAATPGKIVMSLKVVSADEHRLSGWRILVRSMLRIVDGLPFLYLVGLIVVAVTDRNQRLGDMAAHTLVVRA